MTDTLSRTFHIVTLGCSKNRVDSDGMAHLLRGRGMQPAAAPEARVVIVNTCGFLGAARDESVGVIQEMLDARQPGQVVIAAGCMPALGDYASDIPTGVDRVLTTREWFRIGEVVGNLLGERVEPESAGCQGMLTTFSPTEAGPSAYVKIADGCDHNCHFCTIPSIKGRQMSKRPLHVMAEIVDLVARGTQEIVLVAQDTIRYGADLGIKHGLPQLLESIAEQVPNLPWLRMLYIYPSPLTLRMVDVMAQHDALLPYLDMPIQHADRTVLRTMNRPSDIDMTLRLIDHARTKLTDPVLRTTLIVGYPGETDAQFQTLYDFIAAQELDHVGVFTWSPEPGTKAVELDLPRVPPAIAEERRNAIMEVQQGISLKKNRALVGQTLQVLIEAVGEAEDDRGNSEPISVGRARRHAPEVDGMVFVPGERPVGELIELEIAEATPYDLWAYAPGVERRAARPNDTHAATGRAIRKRAKTRRAMTNRPERRGGRPLPVIQPAAD
ncbi:MAG: 30S ribosomal protein S12 methylthiotransferase RimO [Thermomicrobiales bacterium]|nr:30S ribosomal protein S12 methylthiotransferase RimO [Thermomicrobiales bacterium]